jgi:hypothetical protein
MSLDRTDAPVTDEYVTVCVAFELSKAKWKLGVVLPGSQKMSRYTIAGGFDSVDGAVGGCAGELSAAANSSHPVLLQAGLTDIGCTVG